MTHLSLRRRTMAAALTAFTACAAMAPAWAQEDAEIKERAKNSTAISGGAAAASERARQQREQKQRKSETPPLYPAATRKEPAAESSSEGAKHLKRMIELLDAHDAAGLDAELQALLAKPSANAYDKSFAYQVAANAAADAKRDEQALDYFQKALDANGLDNNGHYQVMYNLAVMQYQAGHPDLALKTLDRFLDETKSDKPDQLGFKAGLLADLKRPAEAVAIYDSLLAKNPGDKKTLMNAVSLYQQAGQDERANALMLDAYNKGMLTTAQEYRALYVGYLMAGKVDEALKIIDAGTAKGVLTPSPDLARDYAYAAQTAYGAGKPALAIDLFKRAAPMAADGETWLNLARVYSNEKRISDAKAAAQQALAKGLKKPEDAKRILALPGK